VPIPKKTALAATVGLGLPLSLSLAAPAGASDPVTRTTTWSGTYQGHALSCDVRADSNVDGDEIGHMLVYYATEMVDEDPRCRKAISGVSAYVTYQATDGTTDYFESTATGSRTYSVARVSRNPEDVVVLHLAYFRCDAGPNGCEHSITTHPWPYGSK
jgi:hypothetical protein